MRRSSSFSTGRIEHLYQDPHAEAPRLFLHYGDLLDQSSLMSHLHAVKPDEIYNLGAQSHVKVSFEMPEFTAESAGMGALRLLEAIRTADWPIRFYQAGSVRDVRRRAREPADREDALQPAQPLRGGQGLRAPHHHRLPRRLRHPRQQRHPLQPRVTATWRDLRHAQDHPRRGGHRGRLAGQALPGQSRCQARLGLRRRVRRGHVADAPAGRARRLRHRHRRDALGPRVRGASPSAWSGSTGATTSRSTPATTAPPRSRSCWATPPRPSACWAGDHRRPSTELVRIMLEADLWEAEVEGIAAAASAALMGGALQGRRVMVTGGAGFLGRAVVRRLGSADVADIFVPRSAQYDLRTVEGVRRGAGGRRRRTWSSISPRSWAASAPTARTRARSSTTTPSWASTSWRARDWPAWRSSSPSGRSAPIPSSRRCRSRRTTSGTATRRRPTRPTAWPRRCCWSRGRRIGQQYGFNVIHLIPVNLYGPGDNFDPATSHVIPALIKKCVDARESGADHIEVWGTGSASREFLYVDDAAEGIVLGAERYDTTARSR